MWFFRSPLKLKRAEQISHLNFVVVCFDTSCFILICLDRFPFDAKAKGHMEQLKGLIPSSDSIISSKFSEKKEKIQYSHNFQDKKFHKSKIYKFSYRVDQRCCPGGNCPETPPPGDPPRGVSGGSPDILAKITGKSRLNFQKNFFFAFFFENFVWICQ